MAKRKAKYTSTPISKMSKEDKEFFRDMLDTLKLFYRQREALFQICESQLKNWQPVYHVLQGEPEILRKADELFAVMYAGVASGKRDSFAQLSKDPLAKWRPN
jgi:hypothetical protein